MTNGDWPAPEPHEEQPRLPLPRVDDLPVAEQGYDREAVQEAFDAFYRHAAQLDATLRTLEAVEVFQRTASELRAEMRTIRAGGWTVSSYGGRGGYGAARGGGVREWSLPPAFPRIAAEAVFLIVIGIVVGVAGWSRIAIVLVMGLALALVWLVELVASRERAVPRTAVAPPQAPKLDEEPAELPAGESAAAPDEEGPDAMTILGTVESAQAESEDTEEEPEPEPEQEPEPVLEPEAAAFVEAEAKPVEEAVESEPPQAGEAVEPGSARVADTAAAEADEEPEREPEPPPEIQVPPPSPIVAPGGAPPIPAPIPPVKDEPESTAAEADLAAAAVDAGDEIDEAPEAERAEELVVQSHVVEAGADEAEEDTLSGIEAVSAPPRRRRFRFLRRRRDEAADAPQAEAVAARDPEPEPAVDDPWVVPTSQRAADEYGALQEATGLDPWEQGSEPAVAAAAADEEHGAAEDSERLEPVVEPDGESAADAGVEPEPVELFVDSDEEVDVHEQEQEPTPAELPVNVLAEQAAAAIDRSRARRRRAPRRARRR